MIHDIAKEVTADLASRGVPFGLLLNDSPKGRSSFASTRMTVEHTKGLGADRFGPVRSMRTIDKHVATKSAGYTIEIYAKSTRGGALLLEHEVLAEELCDQIVVSLRIVSSRRENALTITGAGFVEIEGFEGSEKPGGALYVITFTFDRAVFARTWKGELTPTVTFGDGSAPTDVRIGSTTKVSSSEANTDMTAPPPDATTSCGG